MGGNIMIITSLNNEHIKEINKLKEKKYRDITNTFLIEGAHLVFEAIKENLVKELIVLEGEDFYSENIPITFVSKEVMKKISNMDSYPKVVAVSYKKKEEKIGNKILILDDIQDPGNLGTIIRSSVAFDIDTIVLSPRCVDLYNSKVIRSTQGMLFHINIIVRELEPFIINLKKDNYKIMGTKVDNGCNIRSTIISTKYALIIGNEGQGMSKKVSDLCDEYLYIKMNAMVESLNAGVATSILLYELYNK